MHVYAPPVGPGQTYSQGFWYAVLASILYWINAVLLMIHICGYFLGHYPQRTLSEDRGRVLIIKTTLFFFWMAAGAGIFSKLCGFSYADALYFCNGTLLAIGYGNFAPPSDAGRGLVVPYTVIGIIILGLMINSLLEFAKTLKDYPFLNWKEKFLASPQRKKISELREEKERFDAMKETHANAMKFSQYYALIVDVLAFSILLFVGALVFMLAERGEQDVSYSAALYFSYVSLPAIGYGGLVLESNVGKPFFIVWSLFVIPTLAILIADTINVVIAAINRRAITNAKRTALPREGAWHEQLATNDCLSDHDLAQKLSIAIKNCANDLYNDPSKEYCYEEWVEFVHLLRFSAKRGEEIERGGEKGIVERAHLLRFSAKRGGEIERGEEKGIVKGDWTGPNSPFLVDLPQAKWILDELLKSLDRYLRKQIRRVDRSQDFDLETR
jgi:potassium channel subfamily K, other eukaryote